MRKKLALALTGVATLFALTACGGGSAAAPSASNTGEAAAPIVVKVGASPIPHAQILEYIDQNLAAKAGIDLDITQIDDYQTPNIALADKTLDANYFQTQAYLDDQMKTKGYKFEPGAGVHVEPLTAFSKQFKDVASVTEGSTVLLNNDPVNQLRGLRVLETAGLLTGLEVGDSALSLTDNAAKNPKKLTFQEVNSEQVPKFYQEDPKIGLAIINGNYIVAAKLNPEEIIAQEAAVNNPNANFLTWREGEKTDGVAKLEELLHSDEVREYIKSTWTDGSVLPAF